MKKALLWVLICFLLTGCAPDQPANSGAENGQEAATVVLTESSVPGDQPSDPAKNQNDQTTEATPPVNPALSASGNNETGQDESGAPKVNTFADAVDIVLRDIEYVDENLYSIVDETFDREDIFVVAIRRNKDTVIGSWFEVNRKTGLLRNTGGGADFDPGPGEKDVWHMPQDTFVAVGNKVYYIKDGHDSSINVRVCNESGNILSDEIFRGTPHEFETLTKAGNSLYTIDTGYMRIYRIDLSTSEKEELAAMNIPFNPNAEVSSRSMDEKQVEYVLTQLVEPGSPFEGYELIYRYDITKNTFEFKGRYHHRGGNRKYNIGWDFEQRKESKGEKEVSFTEVYLLINDERKYIGRLDGMAQEVPAASFPEDSVMACQSSSGKGPAYVALLHPDRLLVCTDEYFQYDNDTERKKKGVALLEYMLDLNSDVEADLLPLEGNWAFSPRSKIFPMNYRLGGLLMTIDEADEQHIKGAIYQIQMPPANRVAMVEIDGELINNVLQFHYDNDGFDSAGDCKIVVKSNESIEVIIRSDGMAESNPSGWMLDSQTALFEKVPYLMGNELLAQLIKEYEAAMTMAINEDNFYLVEPYLKEDSPLYLFQQKLVSDLNRKNVKEELISLHIASIEDINYGSRKCKRIEVYEKFKIIRPSGPEVKEFVYRYYAEATGDGYSLYDIEKVKTIAVTM